MRLILYGPQGAGKTTQAKLLAQKFGIIYISTGQISRQISGEDSPEGRLVKGLIDKGEPTPKEIINKRLETILSSESAAKGYILDGFPRFGDQLEFLENYLAKTNTQIDKVICIDLPVDEAVKRLRARAAKELRADDTPEAIARRLQLYHEQTEPIIEYYRKSGKLVIIDGRGTIEEVHHSILENL